MLTPHKPTNPRKPRLTFNTAPLPKPYVILDITWNHPEALRRNHIAPKTKQPILTLYVQHGNDTLGHLMALWYLLPVVMDANTAKQFDSKFIPDFVFHRAQDKKTMPVILNGSGLKKNIVAIHIPTSRGECFLEVTLEGNVCIHRAPIGLDLHISTLGSIRTEGVIEGSALDFSTQSFINRRSLMVDTINIQANVQPGDIQNDACLVAKQKMTVEGFVLIVEKKLSAKALMIVMGSLVKNSALLSANHLQIKVGDGSKGNILNAKGAILQGEQLIVDSFIMHNEGVLKSSVQLTANMKDHVENTKTGKIEVETFNLTAYRATNQGVMKIKSLSATVQSRFENGGRLEAQNLMIKATHPILGTLKNSAEIGAHHMELKAPTVCNIAVHWINKQRIASTGFIKITAEDYHLLVGAQLISKETLTIEQGHCHNQGRIESTQKDIELNLVLFENEEEGILNCPNQFVMRANRCVNAGRIEQARYFDIALKQLETKPSGKWVLPGRGTIKAALFIHKGYFACEALTLQSSECHMTGKMKSTGPIRWSGKTFFLSKTGKIQTNDVLEITAERTINLQGEIKAQAIILTSGLECVIHGTLLADTIVFSGPSLSHTAGLLKAQTLDITAVDIQLTAECELDQDIRCHHQGGQWEVDTDKICAQGMVRFYWLEGRTIDKTLNLQGGIHYELPPTAVKPLHFVVNQRVKGHFKVVQPMAFQLGTAKECITLSSEQGSIEIEASDIHGVNGRLIGALGVTLNSNQAVNCGIPVYATEENPQSFAHRYRRTQWTRTRFGWIIPPTIHTALGKRGRIDTMIGVYRHPSKIWNKPIHHTLSILSGGDVTLIGKKVFWNHLEMQCLGDLYVHGQEPLEDISSDITVQGNAYLNVPSVTHQVLWEVYNLTGQSEKRNNPWALEADRRFYEQQQVITRPGFFKVGKTLELSGKHNKIVGSQVQCGQLIGFYQLQSVENYQTYAEYDLYGKPKKPWWVVNEKAVTRSITVGQCSVSTSIAVQNLAVNIQGLLTASDIALHMTQGEIGFRGEFSPPAPKPFQSYLSLAAFAKPTTLFEITPPTGYASVYKPLLNCNRAPMGPILVVEGQQLRPNLYNRRCLFSPWQEEDLLIKAFMDVLGRGFLVPNLSEPTEILAYLKYNAEAFAKANALMLRDGSLPMLVYEEMEFQGAHTETVLIPCLYLPKSLDNPRTRDGLGGIFSFGGILLQGQKDSKLSIKGHLNAQGKVVFDTFHTVAHLSNTWTKTRMVTDVVKTSRCLGLSKKTTQHHKQITEVEVGPATTTMGEEIVWKNITALEWQNAMIQSGQGGVVAKNVHALREKITEGVRVEALEARQRGLLNRVTSITHTEKKSLHPTQIVSSGPIQLYTDIGQYDAIQCHAPSVSVMAPALSFHAYLRHVEAEQRRQEAEADEAKRTTKRRRKQALVKMLLTSVAASYVTSFCMARFVAHRVAAGSAQYVALQGAIFGGTASILQGTNIARGIIESGILAGFGFNIQQHLAFLNNQFIEGAIRGGLTGGLQTLVQGGPLVEHMVIGGLASGIADRMPFISSTLHNLIEVGISSILSGSPTLGLDLAAASMGAMANQLGRHYGVKTAQLRSPNQTLTKRSSATHSLLPDKPEVSKSIGLRQIPLLQAKPTDLWLTGPREQNSLLKAFKRFISALNPIGAAYADETPIPAKAQLLADSRELSKRYQQTPSGARPVNLNLNGHWIEGIDSTDATLLVSFLWHTGVNTVEALFNLGKNIGGFIGDAMLIYDEHLRIQEPELLEHLQSRNDAAFKSFINTLKNYEEIIPAIYHNTTEHWHAAQQSYANGDYWGTGRSLASIGEVVFLVGGIASISKLALTNVLPLRKPSILKAKTLTHSAEPFSEVALVQRGLRSEQFAWNARTVLQEWQGLEQSATLTLAPQPKPMLKFYQHKQLQIYHPDPLSSSFIKGNSTEKLGRAMLQHQGYNVRTCKLPGNRGFDSLGLKYNTNGTIQEIVILESKYSKRGVAQLSNTQKGKQMGPQWIDNTLDEMMNSGNSYLKEMAKIIKKNKDKVILKGHVLGADGVNRVEDLTRKINALHQKTLKKEP